MVEKKASSYETLRSMGVENPLQIDRYYITSINYIDVLRIVYDRPKGSFLTSSREYKFPRVTEKSGSTDVPKTHPTLLVALDELKKIIDTKSSKASLAAEIIVEIELLEEEIAMRMKCLKSLADKLPSADC